MTQKNTYKRRDGCTTLLYNSNVSLYNQRINTFFYLLLAKLYGMKEAKFYTVEEKKKDFKVQF